VRILVMEQGHESIGRKLSAEIKGLPYKSFSSLGDAWLAEDGVVILEGDFGSQIYVVFPSSLVECGEDTLRELLHRLDEIAWPENPEDSAQIVYEEATIGSVIPDSIGGAKVLADGWVGNEFKHLGLEDQIRALISGQLDVRKLTVN
jgi:hypothetical protein